MALDHPHAQRVPSTPPERLEPTTPVSTVPRPARDLNDEGVLASLLGIAFADAELSEPDGKTLAVGRLAGLTALESASASYRWSVTAALAAGAMDGEVFGVLVALVPSRAWCG
ncbi:MAG: hypothetical protein ACRD0V_14780 [Acidimicrobiales bacterium]